MKCVPLTIFYNLYSIFCISKFLNLLHYLLIVQVRSKDKNAALYWYTYVSLAFFFFCTKYLYFYHIYFFFFDGVYIKLLQQNTNHSSETGNIKVTKNCQCNCVNIYFRKKHTGRGWGHGIFKGIKKIQ